MWYGERVGMGYTTVFRAFGLLPYEGDTTYLSLPQINFVSIQVGTDLPQYAGMEWGPQLNAPLHADRAKFSTVYRRMQSTVMCSMLCYGHKLVLFTNGKKTGQRHSCTFSYVHPRECTYF